MHSDSRWLGAGRDVTDMVSCFEPSASLAHSGGRSEMRMVGSLCLQNGLGRSEPACLIQRDERSADDSFFSYFFDGTSRKKPMRDGLYFFSRVSV